MTEFQQVLTDYMSLEPDQGDSWNPLRLDGELAYRLALFAHVTIAMRYVDQAESLRVLDVGCGNGRSTRMYLDLGLFPDQLTGIDLRDGAVKRAKRTSSDINYRVGSAAALPSRNWDWVSVTTVFSSIREKPAREQLAREISSVVRRGGYVFYFDMIRANDFAGGDPIRPDRLFANMRPVWMTRFPIADYRVSERIPQCPKVHGAKTFTQRVYWLRRFANKLPGLRKSTYESILFLA